MVTEDAEEVAKFEKIAHEWWEPEGKFKTLHQINPVRVDYICSQLMRSKSDQMGDHPLGSDVDQQKTSMAFCDLTGLNILDVGCGGGILSESMDQMGASVIAIDRSEHIIGAAKAHQQESGSHVDYRVQSTEELVAQQSGDFDVVLVMEVLEHVPDVGVFLAECATLLKPNGYLFFATLNRTIKAWTMAILGAEYILGWLPRGTHTYGKFIRPSELGRDLRRAGIHMSDLRGMTYLPLRKEWQLSQDPDVNYLGFGQRV